MNIVPEHKEKRNFPRLPINSKLTYIISGENNIYTGKCRDLSHTGIGFIAEQVLPKGQSLEVTIDTESNNFKPMKATVEVMHVEASDNNYSVGCRIVNFEE